MDWTTPEGFAELERLSKVLGQEALFAMQAGASTSHAYAAAKEAYEDAVTPACRVLVAEVERLRAENGRLWEQIRSRPPLCCAGSTALMLEWEGRAARLRADLAETRLRLAIWSGEGVPDGWEAAADGYPYLVRRRGEWAVTIDPQARIGFAWAGWWRLGEDDCAEQVIESVATATEALAAAQAWLEAPERGGEVGRG